MPDSTRRTDPCTNHLPVDATEHRTVCRRCGCTIERVGEEQWLEVKTVHKNAAAWQWTKTAEDFRRKRQ